jgi:hypothetical protein
MERSPTKEAPCTLIGSVDATVASDNTGRWVQLLRSIADSQTVMGWASVPPSFLALMMSQRSVAEDPFA